MRQYKRNSESEKTRMLIGEANEEARQYLAEQRIREEQDKDWAQRKYELSNRFLEELLYFKYPDWTKYEKYPDWSLYKDFIDEEDWSID